MKPIHPFSLIHQEKEKRRQYKPEKIVIGQIELSSRVVEALSVSDSREVEPLRVTELVAYSNPSSADREIEDLTDKVEPSLSSENHRDETNELVHGDSSLDDRSEGSDSRHEVIHLCNATLDEACK